MADLKSRVCIVLALLATLAMLADLSSAPRSTFTRANYERLELGMTMEDAIEILGEPDSIDDTFRDMRWARWFSPFDAESFIAGIFVQPSGTLKSVEMMGHLPERPLLIPDELPTRETPSFILGLQEHQQDEERRRVLMLDPPRSANAPFVP